MRLSLGEAARAWVRWELAVNATNTKPRSRVDLLPRALPCFNNGALGFERALEFLLEYQELCLVGAPGLEPGTRRLRVSCSKRAVSCGFRRDRTCDPVIEYMLTA